VKSGAERCQFILITVGLETQDVLFPHIAAPERGPSLDTDSRAGTCELCTYLGSWRAAVPLNKIKEVIERRRRVEELDVAVGPAHMDSF
jgi:hypothetical protein